MVQKSAKVSLVGRKDDGKNDTIKAGVSAIHVSTDCDPSQCAYCTCTCAVPVPHLQTQVEELLAALESGCRSHDRVSHIRGINTHLSALVAAGQAEQTADQPSLNRLSPRRHPHSDATLQLHGKAPHRSHSMTPADHTHGRRSKVKRSLSLKEFAPSHDHRLAAAVPAIEDVNLSASYPFPSATNSTTLAGMW